jgi:hypothetical protein
VEWIHLVQDKRQWWPIANAIMNIRGQQEGDEFRDQLSDSQIPKKYGP